jgi:hypothetical protein
MNLSHLLIADPKTEYISMKRGTEGLRLKHSAVYIAIQHPSTIRVEFCNSVVLGLENGQNSYRRTEYARRARRTRV